MEKEYEIRECVGYTSQNGNYYMCVYVCVHSYLEIFIYIYIHIIILCAVHVSAFFS